MADTATIAAPAQTANQAPAGTAQPAIPQAPPTAKTDAGSRAPAAREFFRKAAEDRIKSDAEQEAKTRRPAPQQSSDAPKPGAKVAVEPDPPKTGAETATAKPPTQEAPKTTTAAPTDAKDKDKTPTQTQPRDEEPDPNLPIEKQGPWRQVKHYKKLANALETESTKLKEQIARMSDAGIMEKRLTQLETRNGELEKVIRETNYIHSEDFKTQYFEPYANAWKTAQGELAEMVVTDNQGNSRAATQEDLAQIVNLPLQQARKLATELFGDSAEDVMAHRRTIRELYSKQQRALDDESKNGAQRQQQRTQKAQAVIKENAERWSQFNQEAQEKHEFLKPKEGDEEWNGALQRSTELVDGSWSKDINDPEMPAEERIGILERRAAVRGRAIGFSMLKLENKRLKAALAERDATISGYKSGEPAGGEGRPSNGDGGPGVGDHPMDRAKAYIRSLASGRAA